MDSVLEVLMQMIHPMCRAPLGGRHMSTVWGREFSNIPAHSHMGIFFLSVWGSLGWGYRGWISGEGDYGG